MCKWARRRQREDARISKSLITRWLKGLAETRERDDTNHLPMIGSALLSYFNHFQHPNDMSDRLIFFPRRLHHGVLQHDIQIDEASQGYWSFASLCSSLSSSFSQITSSFFISMKHRCFILPKQRMKLSWGKHSYLLQPDLYYQEDCTCYCPGSRMWISTDYLKNKNTHFLLSNMYKHLFEHICSFMKVFKILQKS